MVSDPLRKFGLGSRVATDESPKPMLIDCPHCAAGYDLDVAELADGGLIRCAHCRAMWNPDPFARQTAARPARPAIVLDAEPRVHQQERDLIDCDVFYEEITRAPARDGDTPALAPEIFRYEPGTGKTVAAPLPPAAEPLREALLRVAAAPPPPAAPAVLHAITEAEIVAPLPAPADDETFEELEAFARALPGHGGEEKAASPPPPLRLVKPPAEPVKRKSRARWPYAAAGLAAAIAGLIVWRVEVVRAAPQTAAIYAALRLPVNVRGLTFANIRTSQEKQDGVDVLVVTGAIANATGKPMEVPRLRLALLDSGGAEVFTWATAAGKSSLAPGETLPFRSRLASPPASAQDIQVRFVNRRDTATP